MKEINLDAKIQFCQMEELSEDDQRLVNKAIEATRNSYAPYSNFHVGACLRTADGMEMIGANQENAAFPSGLCAERSAIFAAQSQHPESAIVALAIAARNEEGLMATPVSPCGACRQVILEMEDRYQCDVKILLYGTEGIYVIPNVKTLLPLHFVDSCMK
ncbi:MAG: cytidine deaminase [Prevotella sp.]|jgi:cytidine deaminase|nr:cytidine deaminase [Prevotella sp.]